MALFMKRGTIGTGCEGIRPYHWQAPIDKLTLYQNRACTLMSRPIEGALALHVRQPRNRVTWKMTNDHTGTLEKVKCRFNNHILQALVKVSKWRHPYLLSSHWPR